MTSRKLQIPVVSIIPGIADAVRQQLAAPTSASSAAKLYNSGVLEIVDLPLPAACTPAVRKNDHLEDSASHAASEWKLNSAQAQILEDAEIIVMDSHIAAPMLLDPLTNLPHELQHVLKKVQWVQGTYAGVDSYHRYMATGNNPSFTITRAGGIMPTALAQFVIGWVMALERKFFEAKKFQKKRIYGRWELKYRSFQQLTIGILGLGDIGQEIGRMFRALGFHVVGFKRRVSDEDEKTLATSADILTTNLHAVLEQSDYLVNVLPSTPATRYLLTENALEVCSKKKPVLINVGRGDIISEQTILSALEKGLLSTAILDVFENEPLPKESLLWSHPNVIVTPHIAGTVFPEDVANVIVKNLSLHFDTKPLLYQMDWSDGY
ncbi:hypothetical protein CCR75_005472 [Bremia lactucae]|uniref:D-isomer specific 2-hydroxyacid dehydrogenase NAD-binding domain-containing protein n=1 Tax=Bremia lactucae TaxID=4779 RepID=A0A976FJS0_BRELC|nr:hypothetical protein CCR75_005472 [Bremia lactucae]